LRRGSLASGLQADRFREPEAKRSELIAEGAKARALIGEVPTQIVDLIDLRNALGTLTLRWGLGRRAERRDGHIEVIHCNEWDIVTPRRDARLQPARG
jgi:hypothetical protein